ncbi:MAG: alpha/beta hydrolase [Acholeplasma sp.]|jgi:pimeloyl-ACP methyl ester carboxylesterase|nr:MAG: alpha/beta hydrolase [Acholeplasma sp.]
MPILNFKGRNIYYHVQGSGNPILLLNGIMMSTKSWEPFMTTLSQNNQLIRIDFFDQGQSDRLNNSVYTQQIQVDVLVELMRELKLHKINVVGISYGGEVAVLFACQYPELVQRLVLFNTTPYTSPWLLEIGKSWKSIAKTRNGESYYQATIPVIYSPKFFTSKLEWMKKRESYLIPIFSNPEFLDAMDRLITSAESYDARDILKSIQAQTLIVSGDEDFLTPLADQKTLHSMIKNAYHVILPGVGHASMYEVPHLFTTLVLGFINTKDEQYQI